MRLYHSLLAALFFASMAPSHATTLPPELKAYDFARAYYVEDGGVVSDGSDVTDSRVVADGSVVADGRVVASALPVLCICRDRAETGREIKMRKCSQRYNRPSLL